MKGKKTGGPKSVVGNDPTVDLTNDNFISDIGQLQSDIETVFYDQEQILSRPKVMYSLAFTVMATCATAYYNGTDEVVKLGIKAIYAAMSQIIGVNVGLLAGSTHVDNITFAGGYYLLTSMSGSLTQFNQKNGMEALAGAVAGYASNYFIGDKKKKKKKGGDGEGKDA